MAGETSVDGKGHMDRVRAGARTRHERILEGDCQLCNAQQSDENSSRTASETENALAVIHGFHSLLDISWGITLRDIAFTG